MQIITDIPPYKPPRKPRADKGLKRPVSAKKRAEPLLNGPNLRPETTVPPSEPVLASFFSAFQEEPNHRTVGPLPEKVIEPMSAGRHALEGMWHLIQAARLTSLALWRAVQ